MKLWRIWQTVNDGYDTYDSAVVAAETENDARKINPCAWPPSGPDECWAMPEHVSAQYIGEAAPGIEAGRVIVASFNAG